MSWKHCSFLPNLLSLFLLEISNSSYILSSSNLLLLTFHFKFKSTIYSWSGLLMKFPRCFSFLFDLMFSIFNICLLSISIFYWILPSYLELKFISLAVYILLEFMSSLSSLNILIITLFVLGHLFCTLVTVLRDFLTVFKMTVFNKNIPWLRTVIVFPKGILSLLLKHKVHLRFMLHLGRKLKKKKKEILCYKIIRKNS